MNSLDFLLFMSANNAEGGGIMSFLPLILIILVFYLFFIRPQLKKTKEQKKYRESLQKGAKIITIGGIHGKIAEVREKTFVIETDGNNRLTIEKTAVAGEGGEQLAERK